MGLAYNTYLTSNKIYGCKTCKAHLANHEDIISRVRIVSTYVYAVFPLPRANWAIRTSAASMAKRTCSIESSTSTPAIPMSET